MSMVGKKHRERFILFIWNRLSNAQTCFRFNRNLLLVETLCCCHECSTASGGKLLKEILHISETGLDLSLELQVC